MKTRYTLLIILVAIAQGQAQDRSSIMNDKSQKGLVLVSSSRDGHHQYRILSRLNYWNSRFDRYWAKCERLLGGNFGQRVLRSTINLSAGRNDWSGDRYSTRNRKEIKRKEGLIKIN